jgi:endonuclease/exonuclease/phosphatase family metal-dependent hydrolase
MTWNLWWRFGPQWRQRQRGILHSMRTVDPDIAALQEVWGTSSMTQAHLLAADLGYHAEFAAPSLPPPPDPPEDPDQADVQVGLALVSRWPVTAARRVEMPARHRAPTVALAATVAHPVGPLNVVVACLEWEPAYQDDRHAQARTLADLAANPSLDGPLPVIVAGDLNAAPDSPVLRPLLEVLSDAWSLGQGDPSAVSLSSRHPFAPLEATELIDQRIDHVLVRPGRSGQDVSVEQAFLAGEPVDGVEPSDHRAVICDVAWSLPAPPGVDAG